MRKKEKNSNNLLVEIMSFILPYEQHDSLAGDFLEIYNAYQGKHRKLKAYFFLVTLLIKSLPYFFKNSFYWSIIMVKNYFKMALRNLKKQKVYSFINIAGLGLGTACCLFLLLFVQDELSYDRFNEKADRIYRVAGSFRFGGNDFELATVCAPLANVVIDEFPEVLDAVRFRNFGSFIIKYQESSFKEENIIFADSTLFNVFTIPLIRGDQKTALASPNTIIISKKIAEKYFGSADPIGKTLIFDNKDDYMVSGVFDHIPHNSHFIFDIFASVASLEESREQTWLNNNFTTYILLQKNAQAGQLESKFPALIEKYMGPEIERLFGINMNDFITKGDGRAGYYLQPLLDIHLTSDLAGEFAPNSDIRYVYILSAIALLILLIACINFMNLSTARSAGRANEVGIRKALGSFRGQLITQFLLESSIMSIIALIIGLVLVKIGLPYFNILAGKALTMSSMNNGVMLISIIFVVVMAGLISGLYPAFYISSFQPVNVFKGKQKPTAKNGLLRRGLVVLQFSASIILIIATIVVVKQLSYISNKKIGFNKDQVLIIDNAYLLDKQAETFKNEMLKNSLVVNGTISSYLPVPSYRNSTAVFPEGIIDTKKSTSMQCWSVDFDYIKTMAMDISEGRDFSRDYSTDSSAVIINTATVA